MTKIVDCKNYDNEDCLCSWSLLKGSEMKCPHRDGSGDEKNCPKYKPRKEDE